MLETKYSTETKETMHGKGYGALSFAQKMSRKMMDTQQVK